MFEEKNDLFDEVDNGSQETECLKRAIAQELSFSHEEAESQTIFLDLINKHRMNL